MSHSSDPAKFAVAVTPSDVTVLSPTRGLYIGTAGDLTVVTVGNGATVQFPDVPAGAILPIQVTQVLAATTAAGIVAMWG